MSTKTQQVLYSCTAFEASKVVTRRYSTSFYLSILLLGRSIRQPIFNIYGMVRLADEIVDTFQHLPNVGERLKAFEKETWLAIRNKYSVHLILHSFQHTYHQYAIDRSSVVSFFKSMEMDISKKTYSEDELNVYIHGSAKVIGLMCLNIFTSTDMEKRRRQKRYALLMGSALQKINFLRDIASDYGDRQRTYFVAHFSHLTDSKKATIIEEVKQEMQEALKGICTLPRQSKYGVLAAWMLYMRILKKVEKLTIEMLMKRRVSVSKWQKTYIWLFCYGKKLLQI